MTAPAYGPARSADSLTQTVSTFLTAWTTRDPAQRLRHLQAACTGDVLYRDPVTRVEGIEALSDHITALTSQFPGQRIVLTSDVDAHHDVARFGWTAYDTAGRAALHGTNTVELTDNGLLLEITAFFGPLPPRTYTFASGTGPTGDEKP